MTIMGTHKFIPAAKSATSMRLMYSGVTRILWQGYNLPFVWNRWC